jgi:fatty-acyl-CoA synthase
MIDSLYPGVERAAASLGSASVSKAWVRALEATSQLGEHSLATLPTLIDERAARDGKAVALISDKTRLNYRQLARLANRYARWAMAEGVRVGDVVGLLMPNKPEYLAIWLGVTHVGGVVALLNTHLIGSSLAHCINAVTPKHLIVDAALLPAYRDAEEHLFLKGSLWIHGEPRAHDRIDASRRIDRAIKRHRSGRLHESERRPVTLSHKALLIYTSGTTGLPKAANVSHHRIMTWSRWFAGMMDARASDRMYDCLPLYHSVGGIVATGAMLVSGGSVVVREKFAAARFWDDVVATECTLFQYIGELCRYLVNAPPGAAEQQHKLRLCCGNGLRRDVWERFKQRFRIPQILEFYAATEGNFSLINVEGEPGAIGRVPPFLTHRFAATLIKTDPESNQPLRDERGRCVKAGVDEIGEAIGRVGVDGAGIVGRFEGYTSSAETEKKILRDVFAPGDVWFRTGDLMRLDARGFYHFVDRVGDTFRWKGENVATSEVEEALLTCDGVQQAIVYGVRVPGCEGRAGMAALVVGAGFDLAELHRHVAERLPEYARPIFLRLRPTLDVTETFKQTNRRLIEEGYDPDLVADRIYFDDRAQRKYVPLDMPLLAQIDTGQTKL